MSDIEAEQLSDQSDCVSDEVASDNSEYDSEKEASAHSAALKRLKAKDPEFYEFLEANDKELLNFEGSDEEDDSENEGEEAVQGKLPTSAKLEFVKSQIKSSPTIKVCKALVSSFKHAVHQTDAASSKNNLVDNDLFNDIMKLCLIDLVPALYRVLKLSTEGSAKSMDPTKSKHWKKIQTLVKSYLIDLLKLYPNMKESSQLVLLLKHTVHLVPFFSKFVRLSRLLLKRMISLWCSEEETVRVLSLIIIVRTAKSIPDEYFGHILKSMYFSFVKNTKFTSPTSWPMINFMKRSLTEVYCLNPEIAYEHAFIYVRQLGIHLRNAITTKKKEAFQTVYNWQYVHCLMLWAHVLCRLKHNDAIKSLIYPLVQTTIGTINLIPTAKYVPLRFHLLRSLMQISQETENFIPVLPFVLDVLNLVDYNKKSNFSVRALNFECSLKVTKAQLLEAGFKEKCIADVCDILIDYLKLYASSIGFPELALPAILQIKHFIKQCKVQKYNQQLKNILGKIEENSSFISEKRRNVSFSITDTEKIKKWEQELKTPLLKYEKPDATVDAPKEKKKRVN